MVKGLVGIFLLLTTVQGPLRAEEAANRDARVTATIGPVTLRAVENPKQDILVEGDVPLSEGDVLRTGPDSRAEIVLDGEAIFQLQPASVLKMKRLSFQVTLLELSRGAILGSIRRMARPGQLLIVKMPTAVAAARRAAFGADTMVGQSFVGVLNEGEVIVSGAWAHERVLLRANQETRVTRSAVPRAPYPLAHFQPYKYRMTALRLRAVFWAKNWRSIPPSRRREIRRSYSSGGRPQWAHRPPRQRSPSPFGPEGQKSVDAISKKSNHIPSGY